MKIHGQEITPPIRAQIATIIAAEPDFTRSALARRVCTEFGWRSPSGRLQEMSCRKALLTLHRRGQIQLPAATRRAGISRRRSAVSAVAAVLPAVKVELEALGRVTVEVVPTGRSAASQKWNELMSQYHYLGAGPLCGAQLRYLIESERYGLIGGVSFSGAAWTLTARDEWMGWSREERERGLNKVVCNSRFLIVPTVKVKNLASQVLGQVLGRLGADWEERYGYRPVMVETFVEEARFGGTSYRAANFVKVGQSAGRGRQDRWSEYGKEVKGIYVYPLTADWRRELGLAERVAAGSEADWVETEFGGAELGDKRLAKRLSNLGRDFYEHPQGSLPEACGSLAKVKGAYRLFAHAEVTLERILAPHYAATRKRMAGEAVVLAVQDSTSLNYPRHQAVEGLGPINTRADGAQGLWVHETLTFTPAGLPLGLLDVQAWAREEYREEGERKSLPLEEKESQKWLTSYEAASAAQRECPRTLVVSVGDREADIYELFKAAAESEGGAQLLIRAERSRQRRDENGELVWERLRQAPTQDERVIELPRREGQKGRKAIVELRSARVRLKPPKEHEGEWPMVEVSAVLAWERNVPAGVEAVEWLLLTTVMVVTVKDGWMIVGWYTKRWGIEVYHRTMKSGRRIEDRQLQKAERLLPCLAVEMVVAWRILLMTHLGRVQPQQPCTAILQEVEWQALYILIFASIQFPQTPPTVAEVVRWTAQLGGFLGRKRDGHPGVMTLWKGFRKVVVAATVWSIVSGQKYQREESVAIQYLDDG